MFFHIKNKKLYTSFIYSCASNINEKYIDLLLNDHKINLYLFNIDGFLHDDNNLGFIFIRKTYSKKQHLYYLLLIGIHPEFRNLGYGKMILDDFIQSIKINNTKQYYMIVHSTQNNLNFYIQYGFQISLSPKKYKIIYQYENYNDHDIIMNLNLNSFKNIQ